MLEVAAKNRAMLNFFRKNKIECSETKDNSVSGEKESPVSGCKATKDKKMKLKQCRIVLVIKTTCKLFS